MAQLAGVTRVLRKEIREATRDRNLLLNVVIMPLFLYPMIGFGAFQVIQVIHGISSRTPKVIAVAPGVPGAVRDSLAALEHHEIVPIPDELAGGSFAPEGFRTWRRAASETGRRIPDVLLLWETRADGDSATIVLDASRDRSVETREDVKNVLATWQRGRSLEELRRLGLAEADLEPWRVEEEDTASARERGRELMAAVLPLILLLMLTMGTFASSLDTVVGERERGTLETLLTSPLRRGDVLIGKYLFVVCSSLVAFLMNLGSMSLFGMFVLRLLDAGDKLTITLPLTAFGLMMGAATLLAAFLGALLMVLALPARTYREGQAMLSPFYLLIMVPGMIVVTSRDAFAMKHALVPVLNATALFKSALRGEYPPGPVLVTYAVLTVCTAAVLVFAARLASREDVLLEPKRSLRGLLTGRSGGRT